MNQQKTEDKLTTKTYTPEDLAAMPMATKLKMLHEGMVDTYLMYLQSGSIHPRDLAPLMTLLKNNEIKEDKPIEDSMADKVRAALEED